MLAEFFDKLRKSVDEAQTPKPWSDPRLPDTLFIFTNGKIEKELDLPPPPVNAIAHDPYSFSQLVDRYERNGQMVTYISDASVVATLDLARRERITMPFVFSNRWRTLQKLAGGAPMTARDAINMIRFELQGVGADHLVAKLSKITVRSTSVQTAVAKHGQDTLGLDVERKIDQAERIPDTFVVKLSPFANAELCCFEVEVGLGVQLNTDDGTVVIKPLADELNNAITSALEQVRELLRGHMGKDTVIVFGRPVNAAIAVNQSIG